MEEGIGFMFSNHAMKSIKHYEVDNEFTIQILTIDEDPGHMQSGIGYNPNQKVFIRLYDFQFM
jgi:hypothetical protein